MRWAAVLYKLEGEAFADGWDPILLTWINLTPSMDK